MGNRSGSLRRMSSSSETTWSFGRFIYQHRLSLGPVSMMVVSVLTLAFIRPETQDELLVALGLGTGFLSVLASGFRLAGHRHVDWPGTAASVEPAVEDELWREWRLARARERLVSDAERAGYDYLGKFLALDAALFALIATFTHLIFVWVK